MYKIAGNTDLTIQIIYVGVQSEWIMWNIVIGLNYDITANWFREDVRMWLLELTRWFNEDTEWHPKRVWSIFFLLKCAQLARLSILVIPPPTRIGPHIPQELALEDWGPLLGQLDWNWGGLWEEEEKQPESKPLLVARA